ncbi:MAG: NrfD/PsrC family molybdoenzyme membrane anchor subunit [Sulfurimonas sp.]|jgi:formate-dependent nitrite reductase membrane component NrfD|uniref:NrfD/PsrC family molybdoenzyme membrane anchor subunit n=1 Tax=unclassified Sulfurimonas TaxID=2623549 RepID=UPI0008D6DD7A|nr:MULTISPECIES: NrfD/PsrC family molybdoenzyme membrane anchor subunit [unclassified Sulfurimonas]OHE11962.1 MAG: polysulfide reductase [Sulfurimonas sp. RIFOXYC2_FULL_36_7]OHE16200.1 MAG: polysulfide reductase [Sulfurimonas sp. RIFOXYD12_FULL_36_11]MBS4068298.1 polysulfide reductase NrfD [Sulfurimonas sp.]MDD3855116.1 polysulfide reductase NrfD [Sulfurimonas sp.]OHE04801.1 MAG: polysulfide reductase [Sulfurimonas sp. RIFOXYB12_FULL_35_9]
MAHEILAATNAVVTLDVALPGIIWPWLVTVNMWAKSIGTGVIFMLFMLVRMHPNEVAKLRLPTAIVAFVFINIFLLFTLADLHQPFRMWHIFVHSNWTSSITVGAWMATIFLGLLSLLALLAYKKEDVKFDKVLLWTTILAIPVTLYTAGLMAQCTARELWQMPTESAQMILAALLSGSAFMILMGGNKLSEEAKNSLGVVLGLSALMAFIIYMAEYIFGPMKAEEVAAVLDYVKGDGPYTVMFWIGQWMTYLLPMLLIVLSRASKSESILKLAAILALVGLAIVKHVWLMIPQLLPMS